MAISLICCWVLQLIGKLSSPLHSIVNSSFSLFNSWFWLKIPKKFPHFFLGTFVSIWTPNWVPSSSNLQSWVSYSMRKIVVNFISIFVSVSREMIFRSKFRNTNMGTVCTILTSRLFVSVATIRDFKEGEGFRVTIRWLSARKVMIFSSLDMILHKFHELLGVLIW